MNIFTNEKENRLRAGWRLLFQFIVMLVFLFTGTLLFQFILPPSLMLSSAAAFFIGVIASVWFAAKYLDKRALTAYGINFNKKWGIEYFAGVLIAAIAIGVVFAIEWWAGWVTIVNWGWVTDTSLPYGWGLASFFISMLLVGFHEELFSRGYQILNLTEGLRYPALGQRGAIAIAVFATSALFGILHMANPNASVISTFNITLAGIVLAVPYLITGSIAMSAGLHFSWNFMMAGVFGFPVSGKEIPYTVFQISQEGVPLWTGGAFGPEAGLLGLVGMAIMLGGSFVYIKMAGYELKTAPLFEKGYKSAVKSDEQTT